MMLTPGSGYDLDEEVRDAVSKRDPNRLLSTYLQAENLPLLVAVAVHNRLDLIEDLFTVGATMTADDLARVAWWWSEADLIQFLLERGVPHNEDCVRAAVRHEKWDTVFALLDYGADVQTPITGQVPKTTILHVAAWKRESFVVQRLLHRGAEVDARDSVGMTPLMKVCETINRINKVGEDVVYWLLKYSANPNATNKDGDCPLLLCTGKPVEFKGNYGDYPHIAQMLLRHGADPNVVSHKGTTPLMFAARDNDVALVRALLRAGARTETKAPNGFTAFDVAINMAVKTFGICFAALEEKVKDDYANTRPKDARRNR